MTAGVSKIICPAPKACQQPDSAERRRQQPPALTVSGCSGPSDPHLTRSYAPSVAPSMLQGFVSRSVVSAVSSLRRDSRRCDPHAPPFQSLASPNARARAHTASLQATFTPSSGAAEQPDRQTLRKKPDLGGEDREGSRLGGTHDHLAPDSPPSAPAHRTADARRVRPGGT